MKILLSTIAAIGLLFPATASAAEVGATAPDIMAADINGTDFKLSDHKGKIVVLEWHTPDCPYVIKHYDTGNMQKAQADVKAMDDVEWVIINSSADGKQGNYSDAEIQAYLNKHKAMPTTYIRDVSGTIGQAYAAKTTPHMYVINAEGTVAYAGAIDDNSSPRHDTVEGATNYVLAAISDLKAGNAVATSSTQPYGCSVKY